MLETLERRLSTRRRRAQSPYAQGARPRPGVAEGTDGMPEIEHIVVLMMENHSYDNYLGTLARGDGFPSGPDHEPSDAHGNRTADGTPVAPFHLSTTKQHEGVPTQTWHASHLQWDDGRLDGFPRSIEVTMPAKKDLAGIPMGYWDEADLPFYRSLASTFPLATRWFSSCLGPTFPNRRFLVSATAHGLIDDVLASLYDEPPAGTIFDALSAHGISWANYHNKPRGSTLVKALLGRTGHKLGRLGLAFLAGVVPGLQQYATGTFQFSADMYPRGLLETFNHALALSTFFDAAARGTLPAFSIVDPDYGAFSEENPQDIHDGEGFAAAVIHAVMRGPGWPKTLLVWLYDEHGGYYDHVEPPVAATPDGVAGTSLAERFPVLRRLPLLKRQLAALDLADAGPRTYARYGFRVPAVLVSPFARRDFVTDQVYDHTSILRLVEEKWNLPAFTRRDAAATAPLEALDFESPPAFLEPPRLVAPAKPWATPR
jgi:phospholipase C